MRLQDEEGIQQFNVPCPEPAHRAHIKPETCAVKYHR